VKNTCIACMASMTHVRSRKYNGKEASLALQAVQCNGRSDRGIVSKTWLFYGKQQSKGIALNHCAYVIGNFQNNAK